MREAEGVAPGELLSLPVALALAPGLRLQEPVLEGVLLLLSVLLPVAAELPVPVAVEEAVGLPLLLLEAL